MQEYDDIHVARDQNVADILAHARHRSNCSSLVLGKPRKILLVGIVLGFTNLVERLHFEGLIFPIKTYNSSNDHSVKIFRRIQTNAL